MHIYFLLGVFMDLGMIIRDKLIKLRKKFSINE